MFSKAIVVVVVLANVFYTQCRPGPASGDINVPVVYEEEMRSLLRNPEFVGHLQQLLGYLSSIQGQQEQSQSRSEHSSVAVEQSQQLQQAESVQQEHIHSSAESHVAAINHSEETMVKKESSHLSSSKSSLAQSQSAIESRNSLINEGIHSSNQVSNVIYRNADNHVSQSNLKQESSDNNVIQSSSQQKSTSKTETKQTITSNVEEASASRLLQNEANKVILNKNTASHTNLQQKGVNFEKTIYDGEHAQNAKHDGRYYYRSEENRIRGLNAKYDWAYEVDDNINGNYQMREESRNGGKVTGRYAYDDGNIKRIVHYEADEHGFRILKDESVDSVKAVTHLDGHASVKTYRDGEVLNYHISKK